MWKLPGPTVETEMSYKTDWRDNLRHVSNFCFIGSYLCFERGHVLAGACFTLAGESLLAPSALKHRSWSTVLVGGIFLALALRTLATGLLGG